MTTNIGEQLLAVYDFDTSIVDLTSEIAQKHQLTPSWNEHMHYNLVSEVKIFTPPHSKPVEVWDNIPSDFSNTLVTYSTSGNPLTPNILLRLGAIAEALPETRVIAFGSPGVIWRRTGMIALKSLPKLWTGDFSPTIESPLSYLASEGVETAAHHGLSLGAEKVLVASTNAGRFDHNVTHAVLLDPASVQTTTSRNLLQKLKAADLTVPSYREASGSTLYIDAVSLSAQRPITQCSLTNVGIFKAMTRGGLESKVEQLMRSNENTNVNIVWGEQSELAVHSLMMGLLARVKSVHGERINGFSLNNTSHGFGNHIYLHLAATLQALKNTKFTA